MAAYYNEIDPYAAAWLRKLISAGHIAPGDVDERSIADVRPDDLREYTQHHFFAGIGVWSYALRKAGWPDSRPVWTGSCPCQPFSGAGAGAGFADERHLWPHFHYLIQQYGAPTVFGEQVASKSAEPWLDLVSADMEALGFAFGAVAFPSAGVGAPHTRDRTYWVADPISAGLEGRLSGRADSQRTAIDRHSGRGGPVGDLVGGHTGPGGGTTGGGRGDPDSAFWEDVDWLFCGDGYYRPVEPGTFPLADGSPSRMGRLRAYGNAINAEAAIAFIGAFLDGEQDRVDGRSDLSPVGHWADDLI